MTDPHITPEKVTKPIQLLAAWLVGLVVVNASFLAGAQQISNPSWASGLLVIATVVNVPVFIGALFLLQTKFRPQMQEDSYYAQYLKNEFEYNQGRVAPAQTAVATDQVIAQAAERIAKSLGVEGKGKEKPIENILRESQLDSLVARFGSARTLSELHFSPATWPLLVKKWGKNEQFIEDIEPLLAEGLIAKKYRGYMNCTLTELGRQVVSMAEKQEILWKQTHSDYWETEHDELQRDG